MAGLLTNKISDSIFALGTIVAVATLLLGCCISQIRSGLGRSPHAVSSGGGSIQFNLDLPPLEERAVTVLTADPGGPPL
jgi:hypothetical protein